jgi:hypothetical protein
MLVTAACWSRLHVGYSYMLFTPVCRSCMHACHSDSLSHMHAGNACMLVKHAGHARMPVTATCWSQHACWSHLNAGHTCMLVTPACWPLLHVGYSYMLVTPACRSCMHAYHSYMLVTHACRSRLPVTPTCRSQLHAGHSCMLVTPE